MDIRLRYVYGDWVHTNYGGHLSGRIMDDAKWQTWWQEISLMPVIKYNAPRVNTGRRFVRALINELRRVRAHRWNAERFIVFHLVVLRHAPHVSGYQEIRQRIGKRGRRTSTKLWSRIRLILASITSLPPAGTSWRSTRRVHFTSWCPGGSSGLQCDG